MAETPDTGSASPTLLALIAELDDQVARLSTSSPDEVEAMIAALSDRLEAFAAGLSGPETTSPADLRRAQALLSNYAAQLSRAMARIDRGLDFFGLAEPTYRDTSAPGRRESTPRLHKRASLTA